MTKNETIEEQSKKEGRRFLIGLILFFICFATVDAFFVYKALSTHSGVVTKNPYEVGLNYNDIIAEAKRKKDQIQPKVSPSNDIQSDTQSNQ